jgi:small subunit ribosomal protein S5
VGNRNGLVGIGYGKGREVPNAIEKSVKDARKQIMRVIRNGTTIPHMTEGEFCATKVRLLPAAPGTGIIAGKAVRKILELAGVTDILTKNYGSTNALNVVKATMMALSKLRSREQTVALRGVNLE